MSTSCTAEYPHLASFGVVVPEDLVGDVLAKFHYVSESLDGFRMVPSRDAVQFRLKNGFGEDERSKVSDRLREVATKLCRSHRSWGDKVLVSRRRTDFEFLEDPHPALEAGATCSATGMAGMAWGLFWSGWSRPSTGSSSRRSVATPPRLGSFRA